VDGRLFFLSPPTNPDASLEEVIDLTQPDLCRGSQTGSRGLRQNHFAGIGCLIKRKGVYAMKRLTINTGMVLILGLGIGLALGLVWLLGSGSPAAHAQGPDGYSTYYVAPSCTGVPEPCYTTVQDAVDAADDPGDVIKVATGVYTGVIARPAPAGYEGAPASGLITQVVYISKTVTVRGGYTTDFTDLPDPEANPTTLDAEGQGRVIFVTGDISSTVEGLRITGGDAAGLGGAWESRAYDVGGGVHIVTATATIRDNQLFNNTSGGAWSAGGGLFLFHSDATLSGNTITNNSGGIDSGGGGLHLYYSNAMLSGNTVSANTATQGGGLQVTFSNATVSGNTFSANTATLVGGGLIVYDSEATVISNTISGNTADWSGGMQLDYGTSTVSGNKIINNTATAERGGGLRLYDSDDTTVSGNIISGNRAHFGGGVDLYLSDATLINNVVADNRANTAGSALYIYYSSPRLLHNTIARNRGGDGSGVFVSYSSAVDLINTVLVGHSVGIYVASGSTAELDATLWGSGSWANDTNWSGPGTINHSDDHTGDPAFVNPAAGDYHITPASAAIDAGVDAEVDHDIDGDPRPLGLGYDLGADETGLVVTKQAYPDPVQPGQPLTYTIHITNLTGIDLHATITDTLPFSVTLEEASGGTLILPGGTLGPPDGTVVLPDGRVAVVWTDVIAEPGGVWMGTIVATVDWGFPGQLTNLVEVTTEEGPTGTYTHLTKPTPGLIIQGHVWRNYEGGPGLANVAIYRSFAGYPGQMVATTDQDGYYQSGFVYIPGDETVTVWAELEGYTFRPATYYWRHYYGHEVATRDFVAIPNVYLPLILKQ
jgi:uncharacterized repeat protein (TIGR01451 family)